ncbi:Serine/threonine-protein phosphatase [Sulfidibacter corallicola]|uniref:Serine/threonine-protein phosphatase n=1 Tax=Sulfidibacter corallicola TaxID=2818388 RepID=A0A8A4TNL9_SULCO|nr:protein phosphatase 2C domain-containing protein [Sulfidibacter corallicola]QTD51566.1 serine/threonine-protein phosphatase [Sulfidibacter corallicola]
MKINAFGLSDVGRERQTNQDRHLCLNKLAFYVVADGMGGVAGGEIASSLACHIIDVMVHHAFRDDGWIWPSQWSKDAFNPELPLESNILAFAIERAHETIQTHAQNTPGYESMGTTVVCALFHKGKAYFAHVGDSRCYLIRNEELRCLTSDHTWVKTKVWSGEITEEEARNHPMRNLLWQSLGGQAIQIEHHCEPVLAGDMLLLCSDGVTEMLTDREIGLIIQKASPDPEAAARQMVEDANEGGGRDNITAILVHVAASEEADKATG